MDGQKTVAAYLQVFGWVFLTFPCQVLIREETKMIPVGWLVGCCQMDWSVVGVKWPSAECCFYVRTRQACFDWVTRWKGAGLMDAMKKSYSNVSRLCLFCLVRPRPF